MNNVRCELFRDNFQNYKRYGIPKAQLVIADIPYNLGENAYASSTQWYIDGDNKKGESKKAKSNFFNGDGQFNIAEYFHFCNKLLKSEPKEKNKAPAMIVFCAFQQIATVIEYGKKHGFKNSYPLFFIKNYSSQTLKANQKIVGATEYAVVLYRNKLPKFNNGNKISTNRKMVYNWFEWKRDNKNEYPKIHPTQKPISILKQLIEIFTDEGDVEYEFDKKIYKVIDNNLYSKFQKDFSLNLASLCNYDISRLRQAKKVRKKRFNLILQKGYRELFDLQDNEKYLTIDTTGTVFNSKYSNNNSKYQAQFTLEEIEELKKIYNIDLCIYDVVREQE